MCVHDLMILHNNKNITDHLVEIEKDLKTGMLGGVASGAGRGTRTGTGAGAGVSVPALKGAEGYNGTVPVIMKGPSSIGQQICLKIVGEKVTIAYSTAFYVMRSSRIHQNEKK